MLILTRKKDESIVIDDRIEVKVIGIEEGKVRLGISATKDVTIHRKEIYLEIQQENKQAAVTNVDLQDLSKIFKKK
ncbi:carbon storage regulator, CsrA [Geosporobacter subterraneus DSM 17957]|uniref:Translational regulator CsrA n=1 Tax=Geosporobacter subterraneus DSM 17957 TaxID=1121919 RepID=A0A1M6CN64_9FIRM|nr:carbon storage regulator CsrA [Geosporobacter subterraneus]SHI62148.1 carbon storage regulator, CsrA [Geosporobacter subterraneus DSM 17957]